MKKKKDYSWLLYKTNRFLGYWFGLDTSPGEEFNGNSVLIKITTHKYVCIIDGIFSFETDDVIYDYASPMGNSLMPYPVAYGNKNIYFILEKKYLPRSDIDTPIMASTAEDLMAEYYEKKKLGKPMKKIHMIAKRRWWAAEINEPYVP